MADKRPILKLGDSDSGIPFEIHSMQWIDQNRHEQNETPHRHNYFVIVWVKRGSGIHYIDLEKFDISDHTIYNISPGQVHLLQAAEGTDGLVISFTADFLCQHEDNYHLLYNSGLFYNFSQPSVITLDQELSEELEDIGRKMAKEYQNFFLLRAEILRNYLKLFLLYLSRQHDSRIQDEAQSAHSRLIRNFFALLEKNFISRKQVAEYAGELAVTPNYLNETVRKRTGLTASEHIRQRVILEAKREAAYSDTSMKEIAYQLGFDDVAHFSKYFKNATGLNFTEYKKEIKL